MINVKFCTAKPEPDGKHRVLSGRTEVVPSQGQAVLVGGEIFCVSIVVHALEKGMVVCFVEQVHGEELVQFAEAIGIIAED